MKFEDEIICGHLVTTATKQLWAVEIEMAQKLLNVCKKYNLGIWASYGTLLGTVRHKGFIPWDDDMDFVMFRQDYEKLKEIGPKEFTEPYFFQSFDTDNFYTGLIKIRRSDTAMIETGYESHKDLNRGVFIDVFVLDAVPDDLNKFKSEYNITKVLCRLLNNYTILDDTKFPTTHRLKHFFPRFFVKMFGSKRLEQYINKRLSKYSLMDNEMCGLLGFYLNDQYDFSFVKYYSKSYYKETVMLPFCDIDLPVPYKYHELLTRLYGDYMTPIKGCAMHETMVIDCSRSYKEVLKELSKK